MPKTRGSAFENSLALLGQQLQVEWDAVLQRYSQNEEAAGVRAPAQSAKARFALWTALEQLYNKSDFSVTSAKLAAKTPSNFAQLACICSPNLRTALTRADSARHILDGVKLSVTEVPDKFTVAVTSADMSATMPESLQVAILAYCVAVSRLVASENIKPLSVNLPETVSGRAEAAAFFGVEPGIGPIELNVRPDDATAAFRTDSTDIWSAFETRLAPSANTSISDSDNVQEVLYALLPSGFSTVDHVAEKLAVSKRTLQRKLSAEGETYQRLLHKTRQQLAHYYLSLAEVPVNEIAGLLGYRDPHSFLRAYRGWTGERPVKVSG